MKDFLRSFASAFLAIIVVLLIIGVVIQVKTNSKEKIKKDSYLVINCTGPIPEYDPPASLTSGLGGGGENLTAILDNLDKAIVDKRIEGVVIKIRSGNSLGWGKVQEIKAAIDRVQESGKDVFAYADILDAKSFFLASSCRSISVPPSAYITFFGFSMNTRHVLDGLEKLGIKPNLHKIKDYKSAAEMMIRNDMSDHSRENKAWLLDEIWNAYMETMVRERELDQQKIESAMQQALFTASEAQSMGLIDHVQYWDELEQSLMEENADALPVVTSSRYRSESAKDLGIKGDKTIAVIHAQGTIMGTENGVHPLFGITMGHESIIKELRRAREDDDVAAIVIRVDSPGGDALGSDLMGHEVERTIATKPVIISMVDVAASGGYHISYRASKILANPLTITGSIGSISGKFNMADMMEKMGIHHDAETKGPYAQMFSSYRDFSEEERQIFESNHWKGFNDWLRDVAEHRELPFEQAESLAHGRVWTGRQAKANGLVDALGGYTEAIALAKKEAGIADDEKVTRSHWPAKKGILQSLTGGGDTAAAVQSAAIYHMRIQASEMMTSLQNTQMLMDPDMMPQ